MAQDYRFCFFNTGAGTISKTVIPCDHDDHAKAKAAEILAEASHYHRVEIWDGDRRVDTEEPPIQILGVTTT